MTMVNPFNVFSISEISASINKIPNRYDRLGQLGIFRNKGVVSRSVFIEERNGKLALIPTQAAGGPGKVGSTGKRKGRTFEVPQLVEEEFCGPAEVQGVRQFGGNEQANLANLLAEKLGDARARHEITHEHLRMGAIKGQILDADGSVIYDLAKEFGVKGGKIKSVDFKLGTPGTKVKDKCLEVKRWIEDHLFGDRMTSVRVLVDQDFFDKLTGHSSVEAAYANYQEAAQRLGGDMRDGFSFGGLVFEEYRAVSSKPNGDPIRFIAAGEGHAIPIGTMDTFLMHVAPADFNETVGQMGQLYYAKTEAAKFGRGWDIHTQSNPLPMCTRPEVLVRVYSSD